MPESQILSTHERGAWAEVFAAQWLIERGYYVSRNVKFVSYKGKRRNVTTYRVLSDLQKVMGIHLFVIDNEGNVSIEPGINGANSV